MESPVPPVLFDVLLELTPQLKAVASSKIPDAWLGAGVIRNRVWDRLFGSSGKLDADWDVAFAGPLDESQAERCLSEELAGPWEAIDQRRYGHPTAAHGIASWPETATAIGARLNGDCIEVMAPWGLEDLLAGLVRRSPSFADEAAFLDRVRKKEWFTRWPASRPAEQAGGVPRLTPLRVSFPR